MTHVLQVEAHFFTGEVPAIKAGWIVNNTGAPVISQLPGGFIRYLFI